MEGERPARVSDFEENTSRDACAGARIPCASEVGVIFLERVDVSSE